MGEGGDRRVNYCNWSRGLGKGRGLAGCDIPDLSSHGDLEHKSLNLKKERQIFILCLAFLGCLH